MTDIEREAIGHVRKPAEFVSRHLGLPDYGVVKAAEAFVVRAEHPAAPPIQPVIETAGDEVEALDSLTVDPRPMEDFPPHVVKALIFRGLIRNRWLEAPYKTKSTDLIEWAYITEAGRIVTTLRSKLSTVEAETIERCASVFETDAFSGSGAEGRRIAEYCAQAIRALVAPTAEISK